MADPVLSARSRLANAHQHLDAAAVAVAKRELIAANCEAAIKRALEAAPPLTAEQRARLAALLTGGAK